MKFLTAETEILSAPFILLDSPVASSCIRLGSLVGDPVNPLGNHVPLESTSLLNLIPNNLLRETHPTDDHVIAKEHKVSTELSGNVGGFSTEWQASQFRASERGIAAPDVSHDELTHHEEALRLILKDEKLSSEYRNFFQDKEMGYMVVGLLMMETSTVPYGEGKADNLLHGHVRTTYLILLVTMVLLLPVPAR